MDLTCSVYLAGINAEWDERLARRPLGVQTATEAGDTLPRFPGEVALPLGLPGFFLESTPGDQARVPQRTTTTSGIGWQNLPDESCHRLGNIRDGRVCTLQRGGGRQGQIWSAERMWWSRGGSAERGAGMIRRRSPRLGGSPQAGGRRGEEELGGRRRTSPADTGNIAKMEG